MSNSMRRDFHLAATAHLASFFTLVDTLAESPLVAKAHADGPDLIKNRRTLPQIVFDDLLHAFADLTQHLPARDISLSHYKQILSARRGNAPVSDKAATRHLNAARAAIDSAVDDSVKTPDFMDVLAATGNPAALENLVPAWTRAVVTLSKLALSEDTMIGTARLHDHAQSIIAKLESILEHPGNILLIANAAAMAAANAASAAAEKNGPDDEHDSLPKLTQRVREAGMPPAALQKAQSELKKLRQTNPESSEYRVGFTYVDTLAAMPWDKKTVLNADSRTVRQALDEDHYGMDKVKDTIEEYIAVQNRTGNAGGKILCLVGPPGVGKTSIGRSIARATQREYIKMSLGGVANEAEIRGHSRTYIGAKLGKPLESLKQAKTNNPLFLLDEIDKMGEGGANQGDPRAACLELLDPEQNGAFTDHYLDLEFDMSNALFVATANSLHDIPAALLDRMEIVVLNSYTREEKFQIATRYLLPKQMTRHGLSDADFSLDPPAIQKIISEYTREAGVRDLERNIEKLCRKAVIKLAKNEIAAARLTAADLENYLGKPRIVFDRIEENDPVGIVNGLAWTSIGGSTLPIEAITNPSTRGFDLSVTGNLGKVMGESTNIATRLVISLAPSLGISETKLNKTHLIVNALDGATPKDGPSAGAALATVAISALTGIKIRRYIAMTGEITLHGKVTGIGGLREKFQGAIDAGVRTVLIPQDNVRDLAEIPDSIKSQLEIIPVSRIEEVLGHALTEQPRAFVPATPGFANADNFAALVDQFNEIAAAVGGEKNPAGPPEDHIDIAKRILIYFHERAKEAPLPSNVIPINPGGSAPPSGGNDNNSPVTGTHSAPAP